MCGILLGVFEGVGVLMSRVFSESSRPQLPPSMSLLLLYIIGAPSEQYFSARKRISGRSCSRFTLDSLLLLVPPALSPPLTPIALCYSKHNFQL
jgi:hypothetical protein